MKKLLLSFFAVIGFSSVSHAANPIYGTVQITTTTATIPALQNGTINVASGTIRVLTVSSATISSATILGGNITASTMTASLVTFTTATITSSGTISNLSVSTATITKLTSTNITVTTITPTGIVGINGLGNANVGNYGEYISSSFASISSTPTATIGDYASVVLTAGDWDLTGCIDFENNGATTTLAEYFITTTPGASFTGAVTGDNLLEIGVSSTTQSGSGCISNWRLSTNGATAYLKMTNTFVTAIPKIWGRLSGRRMR